MYDYGKEVDPLLEEGYNYWFTTFLLLLVTVFVPGSPSFVIGLLYFSVVFFGLGIDFSLSGIFITQGLNAIIVYVITLFFG